MTTRKRPTTKKPAVKRPPGGRAKSRRGLPSLLFMETSAQILRITGPREIRDGIDELVKGARRVGTSWTVRREFHRTLLAFYDQVASVVASLLDQDVPREFGEVWEEVCFLMPLYSPGGPSLLTHLREAADFFPPFDRAMRDRFGRRRVSPAVVKSFVEGRREFARRNFLNDPPTFDKSSCTVWETRGKCPCQPEPGPTCQLKKICDDMRDDFLDSAKTLSEADREESEWLKENFERLKGARGKALHEIMGKHPGHVGDLVIFWEVPDRWTILTRDDTFRILGDAHRQNVDVFKVRYPRRQGGGACAVRPLPRGGEVAGTLINYNVKSARLKAPLPVREGRSVALTADVLGSTRVGKVAAINEDDPSNFAVKFIVKKR